jgi:hypothetical protein
MNNDERKLINQLAMALGVVLDIVEQHNRDVEFFLAHKEIPGVEEVFMKHDIAIPKTIISKGRKALDRALQVLSVGREEEIAEWKKSLNPPIR